MADTRTREQRSRIMRSVGMRDTGPEMAVRKLLHAMGYRYRLHGCDLPGRPDLVFRTRRKAIFVNGCFWHGHRGCRKGRLPKSRKEYWRPKIARNRARDKAAIKKLERDGWAVLTVWQCETRDVDALQARLRKFIDSPTEAHADLLLNSNTIPSAGSNFGGRGNAVTRPLGIDLFAGAGGMTLGFEQAGFDVAAAVEIDPIHCAVHAYNFPHSTVIPESVALLTAAEIRKRSGIGERPVDCVFGGPPCQGFSLIGYRALEDPRNAMVLEFVRLVAELDARTFVFENVKGLTVGRHRAFLDDLVKAFDTAGYDVRLPWQVCDAAWFGVPQRRERLLLIGAKKGAPLPEYPAPATTYADDPQIGFPLGPTCADALADIPDADSYEALRGSDSVRLSNWAVPSPYAAELRCLSDSAWHYGYKRQWDRSTLTSSWRTEHTPISRRRFAETPQGSVEPISRFFRLDEGGLSNTLRAGTDGPRGAFTSPRPIHYRYPRCITVREMARLHGFPDWFRLHKTKWHGARQVGNAVPPPLARAVASAVIRSLGIAPVRPARTFALGSEALLHMEMAGAARYFDVAMPKTARDRKSGARKRKQSEIERERLAALAANELTFGS